MSIKITSLELENVKRIKAVSLAPNENGLTVIGGNNGQGKTSVLDAIAWALGGDRFRPSNAAREGSVVPPALKVTLSNGLIAERKGESGALKVTDPEGKRAGQTLLNDFVSEFALNLPKFMNATNREKAATLLQIIGVEDELKRLEIAEQSAYNRRHAIGQIADQKAKHAEEMAYYPDAPETPVSAAELIQQQQEILARNGENRRKREQLGALKAAQLQVQGRIETLKRELETLLTKEKLINEDIATAKKTVEQITDESTAEIEESLRNIESINVKVRANLDREHAQQEADKFRAEYDALTAEVEQARDAKKKLLENADLPLPGLSVEDGELTLNGKRWDCMSGSEQLIAATAIVRKLNPNCGFVLLDKLEQLDRNTLDSFGAWLNEQGLQAIATRVSTGEECSIIIEDGMAYKPQKQWKEGQF